MYLWYLRKRPLEIDREVDFLPSKRNWTQLESLWGMIRRAKSNSGEVSSVLCKSRWAPL